MSVTDSFKLHVQSVEKLMNFDRDVIDFAIIAIDELQVKLTQHHKLDNPQLTAARTLGMLRQYRDHDSLRPRYATIFNQAIVLLVSYFGSSVTDLFRQGVATALTIGTDSDLLREQIKISLRELREADFQLKDMTPDLLIQAKDISFQDMQSISRSFKEHLGISIEKSTDVNNIILAQGCRHIIVHAGGLVSNRLIRQVSGANPRSIKKSLTVGEKIQFSVEEVMQAAGAMTKYIEQVQEQVEAKYPVMF
jgi:hypothetical protein